MIAHKSKPPRLKSIVLVLGGILSLFWAMALLNASTPGLHFENLGVRPRTFEGLWSIPMMPFLHADFAHLASNSAPFFFLGWLVLVRGWRDFLWVTFGCMLSSGLGAWLFGHTGSLHVGASGIIFGYFGFVIASGYLEHSFRSILTAALVVLAYGGMAYGLDPSQARVSWQGHLFGLLGGIEIARLLIRPRSLKRGSRNRTPESPAKPS